MKKIIISIFSLALLFVSQTALAYVTWNNGSQGSDCPTINIANNNTGQGGPSGNCWTGTNINANPGETVSVKIYYHNTGSENAINTRIKVNAPTGTSTSQSFTGQINSNQNSISAGPVTVSFPSSQSVSFVSTTWYTKNSSGSLVATPLLNGQSGSAVLGSSGLYIGDIAPTWAAQGAVVVKFNVSNSQPPAVCTINNFDATDYSITAGDSSTLTWNTTGCTAVSINQGIGNVSLDGSQTVYPTSTKTYTMTASNSTTSVQDSLTINVSQPAQMTGSITATPASCVIASGSSTCNSTLNWNTINPVGTSSVTYNTNNSTQIVANGNNGSKTVSVPFGSRTYFLYNNGIELDTATVNASCASNTNWNGSYCAPVVISNCSINSFTANPTSITSGQSSTLTWSTSNCSYTKIGFGPLSNTTTYSINGSLTISPTVTTTYTLTAYGANGLTQTRTATVTVNNVTPSCLINYFTANPTSIMSGSSSVLNWSTSNCNSVSLNGAEVQTSGSRTVWPTQTTTYTMTAYGVNGGTQTRTATVTVNNATPSCSINHFTANPTSIMSGSSAVLSWGTTGCSNVTISNLGYSVPTSGTQAVWPTQTTTYTMTATSPYGSLQTQTVTVVVDSIAENCRINHFTANPTSITSGNSSVLTWSTSNCSTVNIDGSNVSTSGSRTVWPTSTKTYTLNAQSSNGIGVGAQATVYVDNNDNTCEITNFDATDTSIDEGDSTTLKWNTNNCERIKISNVGDYLAEDGSRSVSPDEDTTYVLTAYDSNGSHQTASVRIYVDEDNNNNDDDDCSIDSYTASDTYISRGDDVTLKWRTTDCDDVSISNVGDVDDDGSETVSPYSTTTYILRARGDNGSDSESIRINVDNDYDDIIYNTNVVTTVATNISQTGAQVNGLITNSNGNNSTYFEYGTTAYLGMRTASRSVGGNTNFSEYLTNLSPNTIYYFRAVGEGSVGISRGSIEVFKTTGYVDNYTKVIKEKEYIIQGTTVSGSTSPVVLRIENKYQTIGVGDTIDYIVFYKNISSSTLVNPMVQVFIPKGITLTNSSRGTYSENNRTLSAPIENLASGAEGVIYLEARVDSLEASLAQVVTTAILVYTNPNGAQENAMAYVLNNPKVDSLLGASAFFGGMFGMSLIGWLLLIIFIMLLILVARSFFSRRNVTTNTYHQ